MSNINLALGIEYISSFKRLAYEPWYALAEFVDNSTQSYFNYRAELDKIFKSKGEYLTVRIKYDRQQNTITIEDNSIGMSKDELTAALQIGIPKGEEGGRSKYGIGMKTAACWFGNKWTVETKKLNDKEGTKIEIDVNKIVENKDASLPTTPLKADLGEHYTKITITDLNKTLRGKTISKIKEFLQSIYRLDFKNYGLILEWQGEILKWTSIEDRLYITADNKPYKKPFKFTVGESNEDSEVKIEKFNEIKPPKIVTGWVGVLSKGSRDDAGFSIIQNNRVIQGTPKAYKPEALFGFQELGTNNLVNQRLVGEIYVDGFAVSHTKDKILWEEDEEEELEQKLFEECRDAKALAQSLRIGRIESVDLADNYRGEALITFESELKSDELRDKLFEENIPNEKAIKLSFKKLVDATISSEEPAIIVTVGDDNDFVIVKVYLRKNSEFEPYVLIETTDIGNEILVIINALHPYWLELKNVEGFLMYIRHSVYDGLSEWKARRKTSQLNPDTIKYIKDSFMRLPYEIINNKVGNVNGIEE